VRPGGVLAHAEEMPLVELPRLSTGLAGRATEHRTADGFDARARWDAWWEQVAADPVLHHVALARQKVFSTGYPAEVFSPPAEWHIRTLREAGFTEAGVVWRSSTGAIVAAVR
jgi:hypothetical protein